MRTILIFIIGLCINVSIFAQSPVVDSVHDKLLNDRDGYTLFLELAKSRCLDILLKNNKIRKYTEKDKLFFERYFYTLYDLQYALPRVINIEVLKEKIDAYYLENIGLLIAHLRKYDEKVTVDYSSPLLLSSLLFTDNDSTFDLYRTVIKDGTLYTEYNFVQYLSGIWRNNISL